MIRHAMVMFLLGGLAAQAQDAPPFAAFDLASEPILNDPHDLAIGPDGMLYVADKFGSRITVLDPETLKLIRHIGEGALPGVHDISFGPDGQAVVAITGRGLAAIIADISAETLDVELAYSAPATEGALAHSSGRIYVMASGIGVLAGFDGREMFASATGHPGAHDVAEAPNGNIWVADNAQRRIVEYNQDLERLRVIDDPKYGFIGPRYMDFDDFGRMVVADQDAHRVLLIDPGTEGSGSLLGVLGTGQPGMGTNQFDDPEGVVVWNNSYFISDSDNNRIVRYTIVMN